MTIHHLFIFVCVTKQPWVGTLIIELLVSLLSHDFRKREASCAGIRNGYHGKLGEQQRGGNYYVDVELWSSPVMDTTCGLGDDHYIGSPGLASAFSNGLRCCTFCCTFCCQIRPKHPKTM